MIKRVHHHLKHWLVAHKKNDHRPHLIRRHGLAVVVAVIVAVQAVGYVSAAPSTKGKGSVLAYATDINVGNLLTLTNQQRAAAGLPALRLDSRLTQSTSLKAGDMFANNYWAHVSPSGVQPWYWFTQAGYSYTYAGENLAKDFDTSAGVMDGWMNSPGHRANVLNTNYTDVGFAVQNGTLVGGQTTLVVAHYGATSGTHVAANVVAPAPKAAAKTKAVATPVPAVITTPVSTPLPTATPLPTPTPTPVVAVGEITQSAPLAANYRPIAPLAVARSLNTANLVTLIILLILLAVYIQTHLLVWCKGLRRWQRLHYRVWAGAQVAGLGAAVLLLTATGGGRVG